MYSDDKSKNPNFSEWAKKKQFWGKIAVKHERLIAWLPLEQHSLDVALVFLELLSIPALRNKLGKALSEAQAQRLAYIAALHDLGKLCLGFQGKLFEGAPLPAAGHTEQELLAFLEVHGSVLADALPRDIEQWFHDKDASMPGGISPASSLLVAAWSHHGAPLPLLDGDAEVQTTKRHLLKGWAAHDGLDPLKGLRSLASAAKLALPRISEENVPIISVTSDFTHQFAGLVMLADWLGSHQGYFPLTSDTMSLAERIERSRGRSRDLLRDVGLNSESSREHLRPFDFNKLFGFSPRALQAAVVGMPLAPAGPFTLVAESDTGSGKTEASLALFHRLYAEGLVDGLYFALPTRVAARELYDRIRRFIDTAFDSNKPAVLLAVPGYAQLDGQAALPKSNVLCHDDPSRVVRDTQWVAERPKRFLAGTIVVGTIDQALMSGIRVNHAHLRSVCLDRLLLVVDEVHSSDIYMRYLLRGLLRHRESVGSYSLLLSATLSNEAREDLLGAPASGLSRAAASSLPYPALTHKTGSVDVPGGSLMQKSVQVEPMPALFKLETVVAHAVAAVEQGARVLMVFNTVNRAVKAQRLAEDLLSIDHPALFRSNGIVSPHHGRFAAEDRAHLDKSVTITLGKGSSGGAKLLIGTQTLEQSLDIDADILYSDLCPMDVLLQRIGRLHRHVRLRPEAFTSAKCILLVPPDTIEAHISEKGLLAPPLKSAGIGTVYSDSRILELTWRYFRDENNKIRIPEQNRTLIEYAMHSAQVLSLSSTKWHKLATDTEGQGLAEAQQARHSEVWSIRTQPVGTLRYREAGDLATTRLGLNSAALLFDGPAMSPFGVSLGELAVPGRWLAKEPLIPESVKPDIEPTGLVIQLVKGTLSYSRHGLMYVPHV